MLLGKKAFRETESWQKEGENGWQSRNISGGLLVRAFEAIGRGHGKGGDGNIRLALSKECIKIVDANDL